MRLKVTALTNNKKMLLNNSMTMPKNDVILILKYKDLNHKLIQFKNRTFRLKN